MTVENIFLHLYPAFQTGYRYRHFIYGGRSLERVLSGIGSDNE